MSADMSRKLGEPPIREPTSSLPGVSLLHRRITNAALTSGGFSPSLHPEMSSEARAPAGDRHAVI
jgi:hypothetical protein